MTPKQFEPTRLLFKIYCTLDVYYRSSLAYTGKEANTPQERRRRKITSARNKEAIVLKYSLLPGTFRRSSFIRDAAYPSASPLRLRRLDRFKDQKTKERMPRLGIPLEFDQGQTLQDSPERGFAIPREFSESQHVGCHHRGTTSEDERTRATQNERDRGLWLAFKASN